MKEFVLCQSYPTIDEMLNSGEVAVYKNELAQGIIPAYAIVSRIGNRYDLSGNKIEGFVANPYLICQANTEIISGAENCPAYYEEKKEMEEKEMKYAEIETLIDNEVAKAVEGVKAEYEQKITEIHTQHESEIAELKNALANAKETAKLELIAKLNG